jgi:hypothetical protein
MGKKFYPLADRVSLEDRRRLDLPLYDSIRPGTVHAVRTGEFRPPRAGEWYLSGAVVEAYRAPNDLSTDYHIARLVRTATETVTTIREVTP